ncbi:MAG: tRNA (adenosine(37)-N6)-dimethylallyltransferase MiaA [Nocardioidaceae bacterium]|nr:tRNA (adenosine(37)-N6)-dimethylallyltransferase MiaA [Nocardioidaceae bacterium]
MPDPPVVAVVGPTAAGKSGVAVELALELGGEVVNGDSMQLYRGMDIGTAKLLPGQRHGVPHHLLDVLDVGEPATVAEFQGWAREAISDCRSRGVTPILVGGSALYLRAVLDEFDFPGTDPMIRQRIESDLAQRGAAALFARLQERDPAAATSILPGNERRVVRALEVIELTGEPFRASLPDHVYAFDNVVQIGIDVPRAVLDERIELRVEQMWAHGFVDEVRRLEHRGLREGRTASRALGYRQILRFLAGDCSEDHARAETVTGTRKFARSQTTWFKRDPRIHWLPPDSPDLVGQALAALRS